MILSNDDVASLLSMPECISVLRQLYRDLGTGQALNAYRSENLSPCGKKDAHFLFKQMGGSWLSHGIHALRINSDVVSYPTIQGAPRRVKLPAAGGRWVGLVQLYDMHTGKLEAIFPDGVAQRMRVGATSGLAADYLAHPTASAVGMIGTGWQAGAQLLAICAVRPVRVAKVYSLRPESQQKFARNMSQELGIPVHAVGNAAECARDVDILIAATSSTIRVIDSAWLTRGMHLTCIRTEEIERDALSKCDQAVVHVRDDRQVPPLIFDNTPAAEDHWANYAAQHGKSSDGNLYWSELPELVDLVNGSIQGRRSNEDVTCFINNVGLGVQFAAIGWLLLEKARQLGLGKELPDEWFTQEVHP